MDETAVLRVSAKIALNVLLPGSAAAVDLIEAVNEARKGNYFNAFLSTASAVLDLFTQGAVSSAKGTAKEMGKKAAVDAAKESKKVMSKKIGHEAAKKIAKGGSKKIIIETAKQQTKAAGKEIGSNLAKEINRGMIEDVTENAFKESLFTAPTKGATMGFISSGGQQWATATLEGGLYNFFNEAVAGGARDIPKSAFSEAAMRIIEPIAE